MRRASAGVRVSWGLLAGIVLGVAASAVTVPSAAILLGWDAAVAVYLVWTWNAVRGLDPDLTAELAQREDPAPPAA